jgi:hypothetical protein
MRTRPMLMILILAKHLPIGIVVCGKLKSDIAEHARNTGATLMRNVIGTMKGFCAHETRRGKDDGSY